MPRSVKQLKFYFSLFPLIVKYFYLYSNGYNLWFFSNLVVESLVYFQRKVP